MLSVVTLQTKPLVTTYDIPSERLTYPAGLAAALSLVLATPLTAAELDPSAPWPWSSSSCP